jgi:hypothetical protein
MNSKAKYFVILSIVLFSSEVFSQTDIGNQFTQIHGGTYVNLPSQAFKTISIDDAEVRGNRFWDAQWSSAAVQMKQGWAKIKEAKLDLYGHDVLIRQKNGEEVMVSKGTIKKIAFYDRKDTSKIVAVFELIATKEDGSDSLTYGQILNQGTIQVVKKVKFDVMQRNYDPMVGKPEVKLFSSAHYFVARQGKLAKAQLTKPKLLSILRSTKPYKEWIKENKLKSEEDIVAFLAFSDKQKTSSQ